VLDAHEDKMEMQTYRERMGLKKELGYNQFEYDENNNS
jgi:hypothetical protein